MAVQELGFINVPIAPTFVGIAGKLNDQLIKPTREAGRKAAGEVEKSTQDMVKSLERQVAASSKKISDLERAHGDSVGKRESQQKKLNAAIAEQAAAEEKYQDALKKGNSGLTELAKLEKAKAKVTDETLKLTKAERDVTDAEEKHKAQLEDLRRTTEKYEKAQKGANDEVGKSKGVFGGIRDSVKGLKDQVSEMPGPLGGLGDTLSSFKAGPTAGVMAVAGAFTLAATEFGRFQSDLADSRVDMQNTFGLTADDAREFQGEIAEALGSGLGGYEETAEAVMEISQTLGDNVAHMGGMTAAQLADDFMAFNQTFERSAAETASTVDVMLNSGMVSSAQEGIDLLTKGMQSVPAAMQDEVFDAMNEYSKNFSNLGIDGSEAMAMLVDAAENGQYAIDKTGDAIKEYSVLAIDPAKAEAFESLGLNAEAMATAVAGGGDSANQALRDTAQALLDMEDPGKRAATAVELFGAPIEDLGVDQIPAFLESLTAGSDGMGDFEGSAQTMADNTSSTFTGMFNSLKGRVHGFAIDTTLRLNEWAGEAADAIVNSDFVERVGGFFNDVSELGSGVRDVLFEGDFTGMPFGISDDSDFVVFLMGVRDTALDVRDTVVGAWDELTSALMGDGEGIDFLSNIIGEERAQELVDMLADWGERVREFRQDIIDTVMEIWDAAEPVVSWLIDFAGGQLGETLGSLWESFQDVGGAVLEVAGALGGALWEAIKGAYDLFMALWDFLSPVLMPLLKIVAGIVGGVLVGAFMGLIGAVRLAGEVIEIAAGIISWVASNVLSPLIGLVGEVARWFAEVLAGAVSSLGDRFREVFDAVSGIWDGFTTLLGIGKDFIVATVFGGLGAGLDVVRDSFSTAVEAIGKIWDGLKEIAAVPVRFVVDTVWNNGLLKAVEAITKFIPGLDAPDPIKLGFARGGILPGFSRMIDGDDQLVPMRRGEGVLVSEGLQDQTSRQLFLAANEEAKQGKSFAQFLEDYVAGYANGGIVGSLNSIMKEFYPELQLTSHFRPGDSGYHGKNMAGDFSNTGSGMPSTPAMQAAAAFMFGNYGDQLEQLIHHPARNIGSGMDVGDGFGYYGAGTMYGHTDHIHLAALKPLVDPSGVVQMMPYDGDAGGGFSLMGTVKKLWDAVINKITPFKEDGGWFSKVPGAFLSHAAETMWNFVTGKIGSGSYDGAGGAPGVRESWREMAVAAMQRNGFNTDDPAQVEAMLSQIMSESSGIPDRNQEIVDVNGTGATAGQGLLQIIPGTFAAHRDPSLPDDRRDPWANMNAALRYYKSRYGTDLTTMWGHGHGYSEGGIVDLFTRDLGGWVPDGALVRNTSGRDELMLPPELSAAMAGFFSDYPEAAELLAVAADHIESAAEWLSKAADGQSEEGIVARESMRRILDLGIDLPGSTTITALLDAEESLWASRDRQLGHLDDLAEKEKALADAREALAKLESSESGLSTQEQRKLDDAQKAVDEAKANVSKAESEEKRATATEKLADAEEKLRRVREDQAENATKDAEKRSEEITKANEAVVQAEAELVEARKQQVKDLDHLVLISQESVMGLVPQAESLAEQLLGMGAPAGMVSQGLGAVTGALASVAGMAGPAGITLGMAFDAIQIGIELITAVLDMITEIIEKIHAARMAALEAMAEGWRVVAEYAALVVEMQANISSLQQEIVRGLNEQRTAEFALRVAQQDRLIAEAESAVAVAEARLALDREIERGNIAAQLRLMGLHEDWDSYLSFQALASQGMLDQWSDAAIGALFTYEAARAKALQAELTARVDQINAEAQLAAATRQNLRNQADLLKAQERLILMSAEVAGVDLVEATATAQVADIVVQMAELQKQMDSNLLGKAGSWLGTSGPWSNEYRGQQKQMDMFRDTLDVLFKEYGVSMSDSQLNKAIEQMGWVSATGGDPMAVLRQLFPELVAAEKAMQLNESLSPIWDVEDKQSDAERDAEDFLADIDLFDKVTPLEETIKGLDYTIKGFEDAANAWAPGNEDLRSEYLQSAWAKYQAGRDLGVDWELDGNYATPGVRDQIVKEVHIHLDGAKVYTADQVDQLVQEALSGTNARPVVHKDASTVASARRGVMA